MTVLMYLAAVVLSPLLNGFTLSVLWSWFVVPTFHLPALSIPVALGVALIASMVTGPHEDRTLAKHIEKEEYLSACFVVLLRPLFCLLIGGFYYSFM